MAISVPSFFVWKGVRSLHRSDTMELPGGMVEEGENLEEAVIREIFEETGIAVKVFGVTGVYQNMTSGGICVMFRGTLRVNCRQRKVKRPRRLLLKLPRRIWSTTSPGPICASVCLMPGTLDAFLMKHFESDRMT